MAAERTTVHGSSCWLIQRAQKERQRIQD